MGFSEDGKGREREAKMMEGSKESLGLREEGKGWLKVKTIKKRREEMVLSCFKGRRRAMVFEG